MDSFSYSQRKLLFVHVTNKEHSCVKVKVHSLLLVQFSYSCALLLKCTQNHFIWLKKWFGVIFKQRQFLELAYGDFLSVPFSGCVWGVFQDRQFHHSIKYLLKTCRNSALAPSNAPNFSKFRFRALFRKRDDSEFRLWKTAHSAILVNPQTMHMVCITQCTGTMKYLPW